MFELRLLSTEPCKRDQHNELQQTGDYPQLRLVELFVFQAFVLFSAFEVLLRFQHYFDCVSLDQIEEDQKAKSAEVFVNDLNELAVPEFFQVESEFFEWRKIIFLTKN